MSVSLCPRSAALANTRLLDVARRCSILQDPLLRRPEPAG